MAFTQQQEADILAAIYGDGGQINDLPVAENLEGCNVEVQSGSGESRRVNLISAVSALNKRVAIRRWSKTLATPIGEAWGNIDFLRELPALLGLGCYLVTNDRAMRKLDSTDHRRYVDGSPAALDGSEGQYMWCWLSHHYGFREDSLYYYEAVSLDPLGAEWDSYCIPAGGTSALGGGVIDREATGGGESPRLCSLISDASRYRGGDNRSAWDNMYNSQLGMIATSIPVTTFSTYARERGQGWEAGWYVNRAVQEYLFRIIMGTRNSQAAYNPAKDANGLFQGGLGMGVTMMSGWEAHNDYNPTVKCEDGVSLGDGVGVFNKPILNSSGDVIYTAPIPVFFGLKNMFGHVWQGVRGLIVDVKAESVKTYVAKSLYNGQSNSNIDLNLMTLASENPRESGHIKRQSMSKLCCMPTEVGGSSSTYYSDYYWVNVSSPGLRGRLCGGYADASTAAGAFCASACGAVAYSWRDSSVPLCFLKEDFVVG